MSKVDRMFIKKMLVALCVALGAVSLVGCSDDVTSSAPAPAPAPAPVPAEPAPIPADFSLSQVWDENDCLADLALQDGTFVVGRQTNLCRTPDIEDVNGNFYFLYSRGSDPKTDWLQLYGVTEGYAYWLYPGSVWFRMPSGGGATEILVSDTNGSQYYTDYAAWEAASFENKVSASTYRIQEMGAQGSIRLAELGTYQWAESQNDGIEAAQSQIGEQQAVLGQEQKTLEAASQAPDGVSQAEANLIVQEFQIRMAKVWTAPQCTFSYNGCF